MNNRDRRYRRHMVCLTRSCCLIYSLPVAVVAFVDSFVGSSFVANVKCDVAKQIKNEFLVHYFSRFF